MFQDLRIGVCGGMVGGDDNDALDAFCVLGCEPCAGENASGRGAVNVNSYLISSSLTWLSARLFRVLWLLSTDASSEVPSSEVASPGMYICERREGIAGAEVRESVGIDTEGDGGSNIRSRGRALNKSFDIIFFAAKFCTGNSGSSSSTSEWKTTVPTLPDERFR